MARIGGEIDYIPILNAAELWRDKCLVGDGAVFSDGAYWSLQYINELDKYFIQNFLEDNRSFYDKLEEQLNHASPETCKLAAEITWLMLLFPSRISPERKKEDIVRVWSWSGDQLAPNQSLLLDPLQNGIGHTGTAYNTLRWRELVFFIRILQSWKRLDRDQQNNYLSDPWLFAGFIDSIEDAENRNFRHILLFLVFPDSFERIASGRHKKKIAAIFGDFSTSEANKLSYLELDKLLSDIRAKSEEKYNTKELDFYRPPLRDLWLSNQGMDNITKDDILDALHEIDEKGISSDAQSSTYDLIYDTKRYPPKLVVSLAHKYANETDEALERTSFHGGEATPAFALLRKQGFYVERKDFVEKVIRQFISQADAAKDLSLTNFAGFNSFCGLNVKIGFGKGNFAKVPWISFLGKGQKVTHGIYPVYLYFKDQRLLVLAYGLSETNHPELKWNLPLGAQTIESYFREEFQETPHRYGGSYVFKTYEVPDDIEFGKLTQDLDQLIWDYIDMLAEETKPATAEPQYWIFQANPKYFDLNKAIRGRSERTWLINQSQKQLKKGQKGFLWLSGKGGGIVATGTLNTDPAMMHQNEDEIKYTLQDSKFSGERLRSVVHVEKVLKEPITRDFLLNHPVLKKLVILSFANASNYMIKKEEYQAIMEIFNSREIEVDYTTEPYINPPPVPLKTKEEPPYSIDDALEGLFIDHDRFEEIIARFQAKKNLILQGPPGVGKTYFSKRLAWALMGFKAPSRLEMVQFHQSYSYEDFIQGFRPSGTGFELKNGVFYKFCKKASQDPGNKYVFIIDEINRGNLSKVFGELMMLIEHDKRGPEWEMSLTYASDGEKFHVPENLYLMGLMNTADRSLAMVDYALRRRFSFIDLEPGFGTDAFSKFLISRGAAEDLVDKTKRRMGEVNAKISKDTVNLGPGYCIGHSFFCSASKEDGADEKWYQQVIKTEIAPLLKEYWFDDLGQADSLIKSLLND